jgi:hypothetical protein
MWEKVHEPSAAVLLFRCAAVKRYLAATLHNFGTAAHFYFFLLFK